MTKLLYLYHLTQNDAKGYDTYSDCVVAAESEEDAKTIHPRTLFMENVDPRYWDGHDWARPEFVDATFIGLAAVDVKRGVICASFHAG